MYLCDSLTQQMNIEREGFFILISFYTLAPNTHWGIIKLLSTLMNEGEIWMNESTVVLWTGMEFFGQLK